MIKQDQLLKHTDEYSHKNTKFIWKDQKWHYLFKKKISGDYKIAFCGYYSDGAGFHTSQPLQIKLLSELNKGKAKLI